MNKLKEQSEGDVVKKYELDKQVEMTDEMKNMEYEELKAYLEKKYDQMNEIQVNKEIENKERNKCFESINKGIEAMDKLKSMTENINDIEEYDSINMNNVNIMINRIVDMMIDNEKKECQQRIEEINKLRKPTTTNEVIEIKKGNVTKAYKMTSKKLNNRGNNEYIYNNIETLETWSGHQVNNVLYDSEKDDKDGTIFANKILKHQHLYFIVIDSDDNVFGHYNEGTISKTGIYVRDEKSFMFTLNNNNRCGIKKFQLKSNEFEHSVYVCNNTGNDYSYYYCGNGNSGYCAIGSIGQTNGSGICDMSKSYEGINRTDLIGRDPGTKSISFTTKRLIVLEMK